MLQYLATVCQSHIYLCEINWNQVEINRNDSKSGCGTTPRRSCYADKVLEFLYRLQMSATTWCFSGPMARMQRARMQNGPKMSQESLWICRVTQIGPNPVTHRTFKTLEFPKGRRSLRPYTCWHAATWRLPVWQPSADFFHSLNVTNCIAVQDNKSVWFPWVHVSREQT